MTARHHVHDPSLAAFLAEAGKVPLLDQDQEVVLGRELRERHGELELLLLGARPVWRHILAWTEAVRSGELGASELMPRGRKSPRAVAAMRRRLLAAGRLLRQALEDGKVPHDRVVARLAALGLHKKKLAQLADLVRTSAARLAGLRAELAAYDARYGADYARLERALRRRAAGRLSAAELRELLGAPESVVAADLARVRVLQAQLRGLARAAPGDPGELLELAQLVKDAQERIARARTTLVEANIRLAVSVAKRFTHSMLDFADLVQEGTLGLMKAADRFDERRGFKFSTYATWWVRQSIQRAIADKSAMIRLPADVQGLRERARRLKQRYRDTHGREPTEGELALRLGLSAKKLHAVLAGGEEPLSFSAGPEGVEEATLEETLPDAAEPTPLDSVRRLLRADEVEAALGRLSAREAEVLRLRYGLGSERALTLEECGQRLGLTRERVRQIEHHSIGKLKAPAVAGRLRDYWEGGA